MSISSSKSAISFTTAQRSDDDEYWSHSRKHSRQSQGENGHLGSAIGVKINDLFDGRQNGLPMYKDKPYSYAASRRTTSPFRKKRYLFGAVSAVICLLYWFGQPKASPGISKKVKSSSASAWQWVKTGVAPVDWEERREEVKEAFVLSWDGYEKYAWGYDTYHPLTKHGEQMTPKGLGWIIVDALDTLMIMNLTSRLSHARAWIKTSLDYDQDHEVNTFETTIRMLGGLLSAHYLSNAFPDMAALTDDDRGAPGEDLYLEKATDLADRLLGAFDTPSGIPYASVNLRTFKGKPSHVDGGASSTAEAASLQLELKYLAKLTGEKNYWDKAERVIQIIDDNGMEDGLLPIFIYADQGRFRGENIRLGSRGDSYYEYLIKQYLQTSEQEPIYLELWNQALAGVRKHLITYSSLANLTVLAERPEGLAGKLFPKMDHLVCFMPGTIALGATGGLTEEAAKQSDKWGKQQEMDMNLARELTKTCWGMYKVTATGLAPEIAHFNIHDPPHLNHDGPLVSAELSPEENADWRSDYVIKPQDSHNLQRPETVESLFYMWRITGDEMYREWGWEMFKAFIEYTEANDGAGFTSLSKANEIPPMLKDNMESFWLAETLKYFYLLFSPVDFLPLDGVVVNTEAHIFPRFELGNLFSTGWKRKPRSADGRIVPEETRGAEENAHKTITVVEASRKTKVEGKIFSG